MKLTTREEMRSRDEGNGSGSDVLRKKAECQGWVITADVTSVALNEECSACQIDICSENLISCAFFFLSWTLAFSISCMAASQAVCVVWGNWVPGNIFEFLCMCTARTLINAVMMVFISLQLHTSSYFQAIWVWCERGSVCVAHAHACVW